MLGRQRAPVHRGQAGSKVNATTHTTNSYAKTFYSTNWNADGPGLSLYCNGVEQHGVFVV